MANELNHEHSTPITQTSSPIGDRTHASLELTQLTFPFEFEAGDSTTDAERFDDSPARIACAYHLGGNTARARDLLNADYLAPHNYTVAIDTLRAAIVASRSESTQANHGEVGQRARGARPENYVHGGADGDPLTEIYNQLLTCGVFNRPFDKESNYNVNLRWNMLYSLREEIVSRLHRHDVIAILPFVAEKRTAHRNVEYALATVGRDSVIAVSAVQDLESERNVSRSLADTSSKLISQRDILRCFDWRAIGKACAIPVIADSDGSLPPVGGKGLTMLAGVAAAAVESRLAGTYVFFSDTDFVRPWEYDSFAHLGVPLVLGDKFIPRLIKTAKTGPGRNNEAWTRESNTLATDPRQHELTRGTALLCQQFIWPLSGNLAMRGDDLYSMPFATSAGIETQINAFYGGRQLQRGKCEVAQVCNPNPLVEDGESRPVRESAMIGRCQMWLRAVLTSIGEFEKPLHDWNLEDIRLFNASKGGAQHWGAFQDAFHGPLTPSKITLDYMLPSLEQCDRLGAIDWERMLRTCLSQDEQRGNDRTRAEKQFGAAASATEIFTAS